MYVFEALLGLPGTVRSHSTDAKRYVAEVVGRLSLAAVVGVIAGVATEWSILHLPFSLEPLSNSAAPWVLIAFVLALTARSVRESLVLALVSLVALVMGFYLGEAIHGWAVSRHQVEFWTITSVVMGPLIGLAAGWLRHAGRAAGALGAGVLGGLLVGEAVHGLTALRFTSSSDYWDVQLLLGIGLAVGLTLWRFRGRPLGRVSALVVSVAACVMVGIGTLIAYQLS